MPFVERAAAHGLLEGDRTASGPVPQRRQAAIFRRGPARCRALCIAKQNSRLPPSSVSLRPRAVQARSARRRVIATKASMGAAIPTKGTNMTTRRDNPDFEPIHASSPTAHLLTELQLYGHRPFQDEPDHRPLPAPELIGGTVADIFDALIATLGDTRLEPDLEDLLWSTVNLFHRAADRVQRALDDNEDAQKRSQKDQDGSEIRSVELERLVAEGITLIERRNSMEFFRDQAAEQFERHAGSAWRPRAGSMVNHRALTSAMIDSRDFIAAKRRAETEVLLPAGPKSPSPAASTSTTTTPSGTGSTRCTPSTPTWCCCMAAAPRAPNASPLAGPTAAR